MEPRALITWQAYEYEPRHKSYSWFWVLGIIGSGAFIAALFLDNILFAVLIVISVLILALFAARKPQVLTYQVTDTSFAINDRIFPYKELRAFWISENDPDYPKLLMEARSTFTPLLFIHLNDINPQIIRQVLQKHLKEEEISEPVSHHLLSLLGL